MGEAEWRECEDSLAVMRFLHEVSDRKRTLFVLAAARAFHDATTNEGRREVRDIADRIDAGQVSDHELFEHKLAMEESLVGMIRFAYLERDGDDPLSAAVRAVFKGCLHDIFGNPFRPVAFEPAWRTSVAVALAQGIYEDRAFDRLPILADALQDAGCDRDELLAHLRDPAAVHVRGCWALDLVLGKE